MASITGILQDGLTEIFKQGQLNQINIISFAFTDADYDDVVTQSVTGSVITSGLVFPMKSVQGSNEAMLLEQGKLLTKDKILYIGSINTSGNILIELGSKTNDFYTIIPDGIQTWTADAGKVIYNKIFLRHTIPGSLF